MRLRRTPRRESSLRGVSLYVACLGAVSVSFGCGEEAQRVPVLLQGDAMGTKFRVVCFSSQDRPVKRASLLAGFVAEIDRFSATFSTYISDSEISRFNAHRSGAPFTVSDDLRDAVVASIEWSLATDGAFDPTVKPLRDVYDEAKRDARVPTAVDLDAAKAHVGVDKLHVDGNALTKRDPRLQLDLNAMAKGLGVDRLSAWLTAQGFSDHMVDIGGEIVCSGSKPGDVPWVLGVENPDAGAGAAPGSQPTTRVLERVPMRSGALATSGTYHNYIALPSERAASASGAEPAPTGADVVLTVDRAVRHHLFDPRTGRNPDHAVVGVTVWAPDCVTADAMATSFAILGPEGAVKVIAASPVELSVLFLMRGVDGGLVMDRSLWTR